MKKIAVLIFGVLAFMAGYLLAYTQRKPVNQVATFSSQNILSTDTIILSSKGDIYRLDQNGSRQMTRNQYLLEPVLVGNNVVAISKTTNYSSMVTFDQAGKRIKTLFSGDNGNVDTASWAADPAVSSDEGKIAYVSDKDRGQTGVPDYALYVMNLTDGKSTNVAKPDPYSGGIAHPVFNPANGNILLYDYYQYDPETLMPYSTIEEYDNATGLITTLTFENLNAYQGAFSPDGKKIIFLGRGGDTNTVTMYIADFSPGRLGNVQRLLTGDLAYPTFSNSPNHIYYLWAEGNKGYSLMTATISGDRLIKPLPVVSGWQLRGDSSYTVKTKGT